MKLLHVLHGIFKSPWNIIVVLGKTAFGKYIPDKLYVKCLYRHSTGKKLNLKNPKGFNEKIQWLKLNYHRPEYTRMVDKYEVKELVASIIGDEYIIPTIGVWNHFDEINFDELPDKFVLKCTHDSSGIVIVRDKSRMDINLTKNKLEKSLRNNFYYSGREWPYKNVKPRILAEKYMEDTLVNTTNASSNNSIMQNNTNELVDYKFFCFNGSPRFLYVSRANFDNKGNKNALISYYNLDWSKPEFYRPDHKAIDFDIVKPKRFEEMIEIAEKLSLGMPFVRVDLYCIDENPYFSELTFYPGSGFWSFKPDSWEEEIGSWIDLPQ